MPIAPLTAEEKNVIRRLQSLAKAWPDSLMLISMSGGLHVIKLDEDNRRIMMGRNGGVDPESVVADIDGIPNDGGDW